MIDKLTLRVQGEPHIWQWVWLSGTMGKLGSGGYYQCLHCGERYYPRLFDISPNVDAITFTADSNDGTVCQ